MSRDDYHAGYVSGLKKAYALVGLLADYYANKVVCEDDLPAHYTVELKRKAFEEQREAQVNACKYAQHVIRAGERNEEEERPL